MSALHRKLLRDVVRLWPQLLAVGLVMGCGVATLTMSLSTLSSLTATRAGYYDRYRFPHVFAHVKRAPSAIRGRLEEIPGVARVQTRVVVDVNLDVPDFAEPAVGRLISVPDEPPYGLSELHLRRGRLPDPRREGEVVASEAFADAHGLQPGDAVSAVINGRLQRLTLVGTALSPEYIYQVRPGDLLPDDQRFGIFWMPYRELAPAFDLDGAFNDVAIALLPGADERDVISRVDALTEEYGGQGAYGRRDQVSDRFISNELQQLRAMAIIPPSIFLFAAAFILNIVFSRLIRTQREQIAALKAFGYTRAAVALHYLEMALLVAIVGSAAGTFTGWQLGMELTRMYTRFFRFPVFAFSMDPGAVVAAVAVALLAAVAGTLGAVGRAARLPPAEAMRPEAPPDYRETLVEKLGIQRLFGPAGRMVLRHLERQPLRALLSSVGISLAVGVLIVGSFMHGAITSLMEFMFFTTQKHDMTVTLVEPATPRAAEELANLPGVMGCEPFRTVAARIRAGPRSRLQGILGLPAVPQLNRVVDRAERPVAMPAEGLLLSDILADLLAVKAGDTVTLEVLEGQRPVVELPVAAVVSTYVGTSAFMDVAALNRLMGEGAVVTGAFLDADPSQSEKLYRTLKETPRVASVTLKRAAIDSFNHTVAENLLRMRLFNLIFATVIAFGVIYNSARVALAERAHELATLRILGFTRVEVSSIMLGELAVITAVAIPPGLLLGRLLAGFLVAFTGGETVRIPLVVLPGTYAFAVTVIVLAALCSAVVVRRAVARLDLIAVLKNTS